MLQIFGKSTLSSLGQFITKVTLAQCSKLNRIMQIKLVATNAFAYAQFLPFLQGYVVQANSVGE